MTSALDISDYTDFAKRVRPQIESALEDSLPIMSEPAHLDFNHALHDAVFPGGKRARPILSLMASELVSASHLDAIAAAVAVEYLHSSALIFDDLPSMDNARERRGRACLHLRYSEGIAIMAALALMNSAYAAIARRSSSRGGTECAAFREVVRCIAVLIRGQAAELSRKPVQNCSRPAEIQSVPLGKTSALFRLSFTLGPTLSSANPSDLTALAHAGELFGEAYQILDDCRDLEEDSLLIHRGRNATFAMLVGHDPAQSHIFNLLEQAERGLVAKFGRVAATKRLCNFAKSICSQII